MANRKKCLSVKTSNRQLTINGLLACGATEVIPSPSSKYRTFRDPARNDAFFFVGPSGALRYGERVTGSMSWTDTRRHRAYREVGNPALRWESVDQARVAWISLCGG